MTFDFLKELLPNLSVARLGMLGQTVFRETMLAAGSEVSAAEQKRTDFLVDGQAVGVKTSARALESQPEPLVPYRGKRAAGLTYALVEFFETGARVSLEEETVAFLDWDRVGELWQRWNQERTEAAKGAGTEEERKKLFAPIRKEIADFFKENGYSTRIIYRTTQAEFGDEGPANLKAKHKVDKRFVVYLDFRERGVRKDALWAVYAFLESRQGELPMLEKGATKAPKVDLSRMGSLKFDDLDDLEKNWRRALRPRRA